MSARKPARQVEACATRGRTVRGSRQSTGKRWSYFALRTQPGYIFLSFSTLGSETFTM